MVTSVNRSDDKEVGHRYGTYDYPSQCHITYQQHQCFQPCHVYFTTTTVTGQITIDTATDSTTHTASAD